MNKIAKWCGVGIGLCFIGSIVVVLQRHDIQPKPTWKPVQIHVTTPSEHPERYQALIHISGEVRQPGVYAVSPNIRVSDALNLAGGITGQANLDRVNLAKRIKDGMKLHVPAQKKKKITVSTSQRQVSYVSLNTATVSQLVSVKGIGPKTAERIVEYRRENGLFQSLDDLKKVKGIGPKTVERLTPYIAL